MLWLLVNLQSLKNLSQRYFCPSCFNSLSIFKIDEHVTAYWHWSQWYSIPSCFDCLCNVKWLGQLLWNHTFYINILLSYWLGFQQHPLKVPFLWYLIWAQVLETKRWCCQFSKDWIFTTWMFWNRYNKTNPSLSNSLTSSHHMRL